MKKIITAFTAAGIVGLAGCATEDEPVIIDEPVIEQPAPAPVVTDPAPMTTDTTMLDMDIDAEVDTVGAEVDPADPTGM